MSNLPKNLVLSVTDAGNVVRYICLTGEYYQLQCSEDGVFNVTAKFAIEPVSGSSNIRIRSCYDNRYWTRRTTGNPLRLYAWETEAVEGTLFTPTVGPSNAWVSLVHVSSGLSVVVLPPSDNFPYDLSLSSTTSATQFSVINYATLLKIPRYVMFKGGNNKYLSEGEASNNPLRYDKDSPTGLVGFETVVTNSGAIRLKSCTTDRFWIRRYTIYSWIRPEYAGSGNPNNPDTLFDLFVSEPTYPTIRSGVALFCRGNNRWCCRHNWEGVLRESLMAHNVNNEYDGPHEDEACNDVFSLGDPSKSQVTVTRFRRHWISNTTTRDLLPNPLVFDNETDQDEQQEIIIPKETDPFSRPMKYTFTNSVTHGNGAAQFNSQIPYLTEQGQIETGEVISLGLRSWGQTYDYNSNSNSNSSATLSLPIKPVVDVPAKTRVTATLLTRTVTCEIPFNYRMAEEFITEGTETYNRYDGVFIGQYTYGNQIRIDKIEPLAPESHQVTDAADQVSAAN